MNNQVRKFYDGGQYTQDQIRAQQQFLRQYGYKGAIDGIATSKKGKSNTQIAAEAAEADGWTIDKNGNFVKSTGNIFQKGWDAVKGGVKSAVRRVTAPTRAAVRTAKQSVNNAIDEIKDGQVGWGVTHLATTPIAAGAAAIQSKALNNSFPIKAPIYAISQAPVSIVNNLTRKITGNEDSYLITGAELDEYDLGSDIANATRNMRDKKGNVTRESINAVLGPNEYGKSKHGFSPNPNSQETMLIGQLSFNPDGSARDTFDMKHNLDHYWDSAKEKFKNKEYGSATADLFRIAGSWASPAERTDNPHADNKGAPHFTFYPNN